MKKILLLIISSLSIISCSKKENTVFSGTIKGLSKGTIYLQQVQDSVLKTIDSVNLNGSNSFSFPLTLEEPDVFYFYLDKKDGTKYDDRLEIFLEPGEINLTSKLKNLEKVAKITGSKNHTKFMEYKEMLSKFNVKNIGLLQANFEAVKNSDTVLIKDSERKLKLLQKQKYLYTVNFAIQNKDLEVAPYITLREIKDANVTYLDTIRKSLSLKVKRSKYGKQLKELIKKREEKL